MIYFFLNRMKYFGTGKIWLIACSLFFYSYWDISYLPIILFSMMFNYSVSILLTKHTSKTSLPASGKWTLGFGILVNLILLGYFKYTIFIISNINNAFNTSITSPDILFPLAISFFTFQQIAFLVDSYHNETGKTNIIDYFLFISFFPKLISGPIVNHKEMMPQLLKTNNIHPDWKNIFTGIILLSIGLFKKVIIADNLAEYVSLGFDSTTQTLTFLESWCSSLSYTFQIYYDFSGYTDMALGAGYIFNIKLPINFNSPYKALNIQDFWDRWHITLSHWLREYLYIPLGGNRNGSFNTYRNILITFLVCGIWHGAGWTFIIWGMLHGFGLALHRFYKNFDIRIPVFIAWLTTFLFINCSWVFFRANSLNDAMKVLKGMAGLTGIVLKSEYSTSLSFLSEYGIEFGNWASYNAKSGYFITILFIGLISVFAKNSIDMKTGFKPSLKYIFIAVTSIVISVLQFSKTSDFIYFNF
ncbi:MAG: MBOAT family protein [Desulfobacterales bacterium]|nr:MBOAT family protein [Desulfobacterales bacterium]